MGSKSKKEIMESYQKHKTEAEKRLKKPKRENAQDIISKSILKAVRRVRAGVISNSKFFNYE